MNFIVKPCIVASLIVFLYINRSLISNGVFVLTLSALSLSLLGDFSLLFADHSDLYFMIGLIFFLLAHILYSIVFSKNWSKHNLKWVLFFAILLVYAFSLLRLFIDKLGELKIPVIVYVLVILIMAMTSFMRRRNISNISYSYVLFGAILFLISDSILALNKFYVSFDGSHILIMLTYTTAQYFITIGLLKQKV